ncbi:MAG: hypothetical protein OXJ52_07440 [Oligoflexia bacterium]|nr:hypothetical protein [Oligoflexia bacterium]
MGKRTEDLETENRNLKIRNEILYKRLQDKTFNQDNEDWMRTGKCPVRLEDYISELVKNIK